MNLCTIIAKNYLAHARVLAESFRAHHPNGTCTVLVTDDPERTIEAEAEPFAVLHVEDIGIPALHEMLIRYDAAEFAEAVKPWFLKYLLERGEADHVVYLDPDTQIFAPLDDITELAKKHGIVLTPHFVEPIPRDGEKPTEYEILSAGVYDSGFIALGAGETSARFLAWWSDGLLKDLLKEKPRHTLIGEEWVWVGRVPIFADKRWIDLVPNLFPDMKLLRDPGFNVAYWNLHARTLERDGDAITVNGRPLRFFHFSGFQPDRPYWLSKHATRVRLSDNATLVELCRSYAELLVEHGYEEAIRTPYRYQQLPNGLPFDRRLRQLYLDAVEAGENFGDIFEPEGADTFLAWMNAPSQWGERHGVTRFLYDCIYKERQDIQQRFKDLNGPDGEGFIRWIMKRGRYVHDIPDLLLPAGPSGPSKASEPRRPVEIGGVNVVGYLTGEMGLGEVARQYTVALKGAGVPVATKTVSWHGNRNEHDFVELVSSEDSSTNLICLQPLELQRFHEQAGEEFYKGRRSIGVWGWELDAFPEEWLTSLDLVDEVWVWTSYVAQTLGRLSSKPIVTIPPPVVVPDPGDATVDIGVPEGFTFLFLFDLHNVVQRKNPLGLIEAFKRAFAPGEGPQLVIKTIHGDAKPQSLEQLKLAAADRPDVYVVDRYLSGREKTALVAGCDCYVSLHRSEGFGLTPAEAMALGKPVIATGYSGNTDFMTTANSYLVDYKMTGVGPGYPPYPAHGSWAEPDLDHAAELMRHVWANPDDAKSRGERARQDIERTLSVEAVGKVMRSRLESLAQTRATPTPPSHTPSPKQDEREGAKRPSSAPAGKDGKPQPSNGGNANGKLQTVRQMIAHGPHTGAGSRFGRPGQLARRLVLRGMQPFTFYQGKVNEEVVNTLQNHQQRLERFKRLEADTRKREKAIKDQLDQLKEHLGALKLATTNERHRLGALERESTAQVRRLETEISGISGGTPQTEPDPLHPLLSYADGSGRVVLGFQDAGEGEEGDGQGDDQGNGRSEGDERQALEALLRGEDDDDERAVGERLAWYANLLADRAWVLNVGCGRGEFLDALRERLRERGVKGEGVDAEEASAYLLEQDDGSIPAIFAGRSAVEGLPRDGLLEFLGLANAKLEADGLLVFEAANPHSLEALKSFWLDPSERHPIPPEAALALCRLAGFRSARVALPNGSGNLKRELPSAHQYAVLATKAASDPLTDRENFRRDALNQRSKSSGMRLCKVCDLPDWEDEGFRTLLEDLEFERHLDEQGYSPAAGERKHRKGWEWAKGIQGLERLGALTPQARAIGVGAGHEAPLYYLANRIGEVHATDIYGSGAFVRGEGSGGMLEDPERFAPFYYRKDHLVVRHMDGRKLEYPDESFEIAFSFSSVEHFGGHEAASEAMREMARVLRPGGVAAITTEVILNGQSHPEFFLPEELYEYLVRPGGMELVEEIDFTISPTLVDNPVDLDADYRGAFPHIVLRSGQVVFTSVLLFLRKPA